ncbi:polymorphic toxin type 50 domain-containing protein, partial [Rodentibacter pneumotropicus]
LTLSNVAAGVASGLTVNGNRAENLATISTGIAIAENAVEHNFFDVDPHQDRLDGIKLFAKSYFNGDEEKAEAYYDAMQLGKAKGFKDNVVETTEAILNLDETVKSLAYAVTHPNEVIEQVYVSMDEWNQQYEYAVKHDPALAGEMQGYILGNFGSTPVSGMVVGAAGTKLLQKSAALVKKGIEKTGLLPNWANANSKLPIVGKTTGYETTRATLNNLEIEVSKQNKHLEHTNEYRVSLANGQHRSIITVNLDSLKGYIGTGQQVGKIDVGLPGSKERVDFNKSIGIYIDPITGDRTPTTMGIIHYSKNGYHIVPAKPKDSIK